MTYHLHDATSFDLGFGKCSNRKLYSSWLEVGGIFPALEVIWRSMFAKVDSPTDKLLYQLPSFPSNFEYFGLWERASKIGFKCFRQFCTVAKRQNLKLEFGLSNNFPSDSSSTLLSPPWWLLIEGIKPAAFLFNS